MVRADATSRHFLAKLSPEGDEVWIKKLPSQSDNTSHYRIIGASDTSVIITTHLAESIDLGGGPLSSQGWGDTAIVAFDEDGVYQWGTTMTAPGDGRAGFGVYELSPLDEIVVAGFASPGAVYEGETFVAPTSLDDRNWYGMAIDALTGTLLWHKNWQVGAEDNDAYATLTVDDMGDIYIAGAIHKPASFGGPVLIPTDGYQGFVVHLDAAGTWLDGTLFCRDCYPEQLAIGDTGELIMSTYVAGFQLGSIPVPFESIASYAVVKLSDQFEPVWAQFMSGAPRIDLVDDQIGFVFSDNGTIQVGGDDFADLGFIDLVAGKIDLDGTMNWYRRFGGAGAHIEAINGKAYGLRPDGRAIVLFRASGPAVDYGFGPLTPNGFDIGVVQLAP